MADETERAPGWDAITEEFERVYPGQTNPKHYGTIVPMYLGGNDPLDGISIYDGGDFWHFVSYGLTELYEKESEDEEWSGYGFELTFKLKKGCYDPDNEENELKSVAGILQQVAKITFNNGDIFQNNEYIYTGQTAGIDYNQKSALTGFICINDPTVNTLHTEFGTVEFIELIGMTDAELKTLGSHDSVAEIYKKLGSDVTDYNRSSIV
ncbi:suppressor of fused domain protein [uncultured Ruminococcus sp.]|uniref:suppressor of fused domain protein n=1 Tax=uncultured Ruminococcus sp. TaxID=165186 RepID=UPI0025F6F8CD|nr:suppressor of fused domain protein [uncultured Ruminococcus sp.]